MIRRRLRSRLMLAFAGFTLLVAALFGLYAVAFVYTVEDRFFEAMLEQEGTHQLRHYAATGHWAVPRSEFMTLHPGPDTFPEDLREQHRQEPRRTEFAGTRGRHYHLRALAPSGSRETPWLVAEVSSQLVVRPMREQIFALLAWSGAAVIALALLIGYWLARRTSAPLSRLATLVDSMTPAHLPANFAHRFPDDEVGVLAHGLEDLVGRIHAFIAREQEFTRDASHELRTPLAVIRGAAERLAADPGQTDAGRRYLDHIRQSAQQLEQTVATLLSLAREERTEEASAPVAVLPILERVIVEQSPLLERKQVRVDVQVPRDTRLALPPPVLHILLSNLVSNAFAHADGGRVSIGIDSGRLRIANDGGIDVGEHGDPYHPFTRGEGSAGFGLGLAIVRRLCDHYAIDLRIESGARETVASFALDR